MISSAYHNDLNCKCRSSSKNQIEDHLIKRIIMWLFNEAVIKYNVYVIKSLYAGQPFLLFLKGTDVTIK